jgi:hypothetical protein
MDHAVDIIDGRDFQLVIKDFGYRDNGANQRAQELLLVFRQAIKQGIGDLQEENLSFDLGLYRKSLKAREYLGDQGAESGLIDPMVIRAAFNIRKQVEIVTRVEQVGENGFPSFCSRIALDAGAQDLDVDISVSLLEKTPDSLFSTRLTR